MLGPFTEFWNMSKPVYKHLEFNHRQALESLRVAGWSRSGLRTNPWPVYVFGLETGEVITDTQDKTVQEKTNWALRGQWGHLETTKVRGVQRPSKAIQRDSWEALLSINSGRNIYFWSQSNLYCSETD